MHRLFVFAPLAGLALCSALPALAPASEGVPPLVRRAIAEYTTDNRGEVGYSRHLAFALKVGPVSREVSNEIGVLMRDGAYVKVRYSDSKTNGKTDDAGQLKRQEDKANADIAAGRGFFKRPVDARFSEDYHFEPAACDGCAAGQEAFAFTTTVHDVQHGHGTVVIDSATAHVVRVEYALERPPDHASSANGVETFGEGMPGLWTCVRVDETYHGHLGLLGGAATMTYTLDHFRRFSQLAAGLAALSEGTF